MFLFILLSLTLFSLMVLIVIYNFTENEILEKSKVSKLEQELENILNLKGDDIEFEKRKNTVSNKRPKLWVSIRIKLADLFDNPYYKVDVKTYFLTTLLSVGFGMLFGGVFKTTVTVIIFGAFFSIIPYIVLNLIRVIKKIDIDKETLLIIESHLGYYYSTNEGENKSITFESATKDLLNQYEGKRESSILQLFKTLYDDITLLSVSKQVAIDKMIKSSGNNTFLTEYLVRALQSERLPELKESLISIPQNYKDYIEASKQKLGNTMDIYTVYVLMLICTPITFIAMQSIMPILSDFLTEKTLGTFLLGMMAIAISFVGIQVIKIGKPPS